MNVAVAALFIFGWAYLFHVTTTRPKNTFQYQMTLTQRASSDGNQTGVPPVSADGRDYLTPDLARLAQNGSVSEIYHNLGANLSVTRVVSSTPEPLMYLTPVASLTSAPFKPAASIDRPVSTEFVRAIPTRKPIATYAVRPDVIYITQPARVYITVVAPPEPVVIVQTQIVVVNQPGIVVTATPTPTFTFTPTPTLTQTIEVTDDVQPLATFTETSTVTATLQIIDTYTPTFTAFPDTETPAFTQTSESIIATIDFTTVASTDVP